MLTLIRNMLRTKLSGLLFILLIVAMGAWGITDVFSGSLGKNLAAAGEIKLTEAQLDQEVDRELRSATDERGRALSKAQAAERGIIDQIYQRELFRTALIAYANELGALASDQAVLEVIRSDPSFQSDTRTFDPSRFRALLDANGFTTAMFERFLKRDLTLSRLTDMVQSGLTPPASISALQAAYTAERRKAAWFVISKSRLPEPDPVSDEEIAAFYEEQKQALTHPPRRAVSLINLKVDDFLNQSEFTEDELRAYYDSAKSQQFSGPDTRTWTEFMFSDEAEARTALGRIAGGAEASALPGLANSAQRSGNRASMSNAQLAERVFSPAAQTGGIFGPVQTGNFYTVVRLEGIRPGPVEPFENVRDEILDTLSRDQAIGLYYDSLTRLDNLVGTGADLEEIASEMGTPVLSFSAVDRTGITASGQAPTVLRSDPDILTRAFELTEGGRTARFGQDETAYLLRVDKVVESFTPPLAELQADLRTVLTRQKEAEALGDAADTVVAELTSGGATLEEAAARYGAVVQAPDTAVSRRPGESASVPPAFIPSIFAARNEGDAFAATTQNADEVAIVQLVEIKRAGEAELAAIKPGVEPQLRSQLSTDLFEAFIAEIEKSVDLKANPAALDAYKARVNPDT